MKIIDGEKIAQKILLRIKKRKALKNLTLAAIQVGKNPISEIFISQKRKFCEKLGIGFELFNLNEKMGQEELKKEIRKIAKKKDISGLIVQLPLPKKFAVQEILNEISEKKDIDILSENSAGKFYTGSFEILPPIVGAVFEIFKEYKIKIKGKFIVVFGSGVLVGRPLAYWLTQQKATVCVISEFTRNPVFFTQKADIIISGVGKPDLVKGNMVKKGAVVIDAGASLKNGKPRTRINSIRGKIVGDVNFQSVSQKADYITPVPGGLGPITVACLLDNLVKICLDYSSKLKNEYKKIRRGK